MSRAKMPASINGIEFDVLIGQSESYQADAPEYPTEEGYSVSDSIILKATSGCRHSGQRSGCWPP